MTLNRSRYKALFSSDWSECLSPNGPFDPISFTHPQLTNELVTIFQQYTGNIITLTQATHRISELLPGPMSVDQMDAYLDCSFRTYKGVPNLIEWCLSNDILFMLNTTGSQGYFQRAIAKQLLPEIPVIAANPFVRFPGNDDKKRFACQVLEISDKGKCTEFVLDRLRMSASQAFLMGDSGGDGGHFKWGFQAGAFLIGSMTKASLKSFCLKESIEINFQFGMRYEPGEPRDPDKEMEFDFMELTETIQKTLYQIAKH